AVAQPCEHLDLVGLELLAWAAAVALLAAAQVGVDGGSVELQPGGQAGEDREERRAVRLAGGREVERHGASLRLAAAARDRRTHDVDRRLDAGPTLERRGALADEHLEAA